MARADTMDEHPPRVAVIDIGSNSIKLLVAARADDGGLTTLATETLETRISAGIGGDEPRLSDTGIASGCEAVSRLAALARRHAPVTIAAVATSAVRDAANGQDFRDAVAAATGLEMRILSGEEEARAIGRGLQLDPAAAAASDFDQFDLGGGSLEVLNVRRRELSGAVSLPLGAVRLTEQLVADSAAPLDPESGRRIRDRVRTSLTAAGVEEGRGKRPLLATGGSVTVARAIAGGASADDLGPPEIDRAALLQLRSRIGGAPLRDRLNVPGLPQRRADIFPAAIEIMLALFDHFGVESCTHSLYSLRHGVADAMLG